MPDIILSGVSDALMVELGKRAANHHRTPTEEAKSILSNALIPSCPGGWTSVDAIYDRLASTGWRFGDSAELIREDRDR